ncbi:MAG: hypothetical protein ABSF22_17505 [Bryobacteraceae bacterium]|jgi:hypothetical protein
MIIRRAQIDELRFGPYLTFENRLVEWLTTYFPDDCTLLGPDGTRNAIREAVQIASRYGFESQPEVSGFAYLWFLIGPHFDLKPEYAWLQKLLRDPDVPAEARMDHAFEAVAARVESQPEGAIR